MPSKRLAVALALVVLLSGCSMIPGQGGGSDQTTTPEGPDHHEFVLGSHTGGNAFEATVTVEKDGETLQEETVSGDGEGTYAELGTIEEPGPYTVTVNTTLPAAGGGNMTDQFTTDGTLGNATVVRVSYQGIYQSTLDLPRRQLEHPLGVFSEYSSPGDSDRASVDMRIKYRGEEIVSKSERVERSQLTRFAELDRTGVYQVSVRGEEGGWTNETVVVANPDHHIHISVGYRGNIQQIQVQSPFRWNN